MLKRTRVKAFGKGVEIKMEKGKIVEIMGPVVDVEFENGKLPMIKDALTVQLDGKTKVMEVAQQLGNNTVRAIMLASSDGLEKDMEVTATGACIKVPVGDATLGRMFNVLGESIDGGEPVKADDYWEIHREPPKFEDQKPATEILETGIKVIDLLAPYAKGGKIGSAVQALVKLCLFRSLSQTLPQSMADIPYSQALESVQERAMTCGTK